MQKLTINPDLKKLIFPLMAEEYANLEKSILADGCRDAIIVWDDGVQFNPTIVDGHNRYEICQKHGIDFEIIQKDFTDIYQVMDWMDFNQLSRRNLTDFQRQYVIGRHYNREKAKQGEHKGNQYTRMESAQIKHFPNQPEPLFDTKPVQPDITPKLPTVSSPAIPKTPVPQPTKTAEKLADKYKVDPSTVRRYGGVAEKFDQIKQEKPELATKLWNGTAKMADVVKEEKKIERVNEINQKSKEYAQDSNVTVLHGDIFDMIRHIPDNSIDVLNTDPPYFILKDNWDTFKSKDDFLKFTEKWLEAVIPKVKKSGRIYISFAQWYQYDFHKILQENNFFDFIFKQNIIWYYKNNNQPSNRREYRYMYEPIFYLYGAEAKDLNFTPDTYGETQQNVWEIATPQSNFSEGKDHPAQKPLELYRRILKTGAYPGDTVLDCFAGSGTTGVICKELGLKCFLIENDDQYVKLIKSRL